jgi:hypothetical protein
MKQTTRLHVFFHPVIMFHITEWKKSMRVRVIEDIYLISELDMGEQHLQMRCFPLL